MMKEIPNGLLWYFDSDSLRHKRYLKDLDFIKEHTECNYVMLRGEAGLNFMNAQQCHPIFRELVEHAHEIGLKVMLHICPSNGFLNTPPNAPAGTAKEIVQAQVFPIWDPENSEAITRDYEMIADENGYAEFKHELMWSRDKLASIFNKVLKVYAFEKTAEGFYKANSLQDVTSGINIVDSRTGELTAEIYAGKENAGKTLFAIVAQHVNYCGSGKAQWKEVKQVLDTYSDIPFDGVGLDEFGMSFLNSSGIASGTVPPFRGRRYSKGMNAYFAEELNIDLPKLLFDMRYAPEGKQEVRIKAINRYFDELRKFPLYTEIETEKYARKLFGDDMYMGVHNTFHNRLDNDEVWSTGCNWWDLPREFGHTDEDITFPVKMGVMLSAKRPIMIETYYTSVKEHTYNHIIECAPFGCRQFHHAYGDYTWGQSFTEIDFLDNVQKLDKKVAHLNGFQSQYPRLDLLIIYGNGAQNNWYPDYEARNVYDINGKMEINEKCDQIWNAGYRSALVPDYTITDGRTVIDGDKVSFNGHTFTHVLFLYPRYAKKEVYQFLNDAHKNHIPVAVVGECDMDFDAKQAHLNAPHYDDFSLGILENMNCPKSAIEGGCIYTDGSFSLVSHGILTGEATHFEFEIDGDIYSGEHTGVLAYRNGEDAFATKGSKLYKNGIEIDLDSI